MSERERLYSGWSINTPRLTKSLWAHERISIECWVPQKTQDFIREQGALAFLRFLKNPKLYPELKVSTKPLFFDETEHYHILFNYHVTDEKLLKKIDAGDTLCEVCKVADAVLIDAITDIDTMIKTELMMCSDCFDREADMG